MRNAGQHLKVVVDDALFYRHTGDEYDLCRRRAQKHQHAQHPLLKIVNPGDPREHVLIEGEARDYDHSARGPGFVRYGFKERRKPLLKLFHAAELIPFGD